MKFHITKSSVYRDEKTNPPCDSAYWGEYLYTDIRTTSDPNVIPFRVGETWFTSGFNHRLVNNQIARDFIREGWLIEIDSLEELVEFQRELGEELVLKVNDDTCEIEIYDDYGE